MGRIAARPSALRTWLPTFDNQSVALVSADAFDLIRLLVSPGCLASKIVAATPVSMSDELFSAGLHLQTRKGKIRG